MAQKESRHREEVEGLHTELATVRRRHDDLLALSRDQVSQSPSFTIQQLNVHAILGTQHVY